MTSALWIAYGALALVGLGSLGIIHRLREIHHLYIGMALALVPWPAAHWVGLVLMLDDSVQHAVEAVAYLRGRIMPDWSPIHRLYVWAYRAVISTSDS